MAKGALRPEDAAVSLERNRYDLSQLTKRALGDASQSHFGSQYKSFSGTTQHLMRRGCILKQMLWTKTRNRFLALFSSLF